MILTSSPVTELHRIGQTTAGKLRRLGIQTTADLLWHLPQRYEDLAQITRIQALQPDIMATIRGRVELIQNRRSYRKRMLVTELQIADDSGQMQAIWFRQPYIGKILKIGDAIYLSGKPKKNLLGLQFINPVYEKVKEQQLHTANIVPFYSLTEGLSHKQVRFLIKTALDKITDMDDDLPPAIIKKESYPPLIEALTNIHFPKNKKNLAIAIARLKFEELYWLQLKVAYAKKMYQANDAPHLIFKETAIKKFVSHLPFELTDDQRKSAWDIITDMTKSRPMNRLLQGDVGSGKTVVALMAMYNAFLNNYQAVLMAPTEILALQHYRESTKLLPDQTTALLTAKHHLIQNKKVSRAKIYSGLQDGSVQLAIGTHSLIQDAVKVKRLGLVVIDEQHRFGVKQRQTLTEISNHKKSPHLLSLTATPIPRTLALTLYGDLDISTIKQKPKGRKPILTKLVEEFKRPQAYAFIREKIAQGQQAFVICPLIDESDSLGVKSVTAEYEKLNTDIFKDVTIEMVHGKLPAETKKNILERFQNNEFPILVSTSVIEVGIDIPHATLMIIEGAERFGLAQLHQFRGRVGRSGLLSFCFLFTNNRNPLTRERLALVCRYQDGFRLAEEDLQLRGEGSVFGTQQSGIVNFKIAQLQDLDLIKKAQHYVSEIVGNDDDLSYYKSIAEKLEATGSIHWE